MFLGQHCPIKMFEMTSVFWFFAGSPIMSSIICIWGSAKDVQLF